MRNMAVALLMVTAIFLVAFVIDSIISWVRSSKY